MTNLHRSRPHRPVPAPARCTQTGRRACAAAGTRARRSCASRPSPGSPTRRAAAPASSRPASGRPRASAASRAPSATGRLARPRASPHARRDRPPARRRPGARAAARRATGAAPPARARPARRAGKRPYVVVGTACALDSSHGAALLAVTSRPKGKPGDVRSDAHHAVTEWLSIWVGRRPHLRDAFAIQVGEPQQEVGVPRVDLVEGHRVDQGEEEVRRTAANERQR